MKTEIRNIADEMHTTALVARDWVFQVIRMAIVRGVLPCNMPLRQDEISDALNISHIPVREAFRQLEAYGLVKIYPNRGAVVASLDEKEFSEMSSVLYLLEKTALKAAVENATMEQLASISAVAANASIANETSQFSATNLKLHLEICKPMQNNTMVLFIEQLRANLDRYLNRTEDEALTNASLINEHNLIVDAFIKRDKEKLIELYTMHFEHEVEIMKNSPFMKQ